MSAKEREEYNIPLISKIVGVLGMFIALSVIVLLNTDEAHKWIGWVMTAVGGTALIVFAFITRNGKYIQKKC